MWSGDILTGFDSMRRQPVRMLSAVSLGEAKWGMDSGGFVGDPDPENYARWLQFTPWCRSSASMAIIASSGSLRALDSIMAEEVAKNAIQFRYRLAPYIYGCDRQCYESGVGLVRPLMMEFPQDAGSANVTDQWMFGDWLLAAPVLREQITEEGSQCLSRSIYLPPGQWIDYFRGDQQEGRPQDQVRDQPRRVDRHSAVCPPRGGDLLAGRGALAGQFPSHDDLRRCLPRRDRTGATFYDDDGATYACEEGDYLKQRISVCDQGASASLTVAAQAGTYQTRAPISGCTAGPLTRLPSTTRSCPSWRTPPCCWNVEQGWTVTRDVYGPATIIKLPAGRDQDQHVVLTRARKLAATAEILEAEDASLSGPTPQTRAQVKTKRAGFTGRGYVDGLDQIKAGVTFTPKVRLPGYYNVTLRAANLTGTPGTLSVFVNGVPHGTATVPVEAAQDAWAEVRVPLKLAAGNNIVTLRRTASDSGRVVLDHLAVPFWPAAALYEAEGAELLGGAAVNANHKNYSGSGFVDHLDAVEAGVQFTVYAPKTASYTATTHYANASGAAQTMSLYVDGVKVGPATFAPTANWDTWTDRADALKLTAGAHTIAWKYDATDTGHVVLDSLAVEAQ